MKSAFDASQESGCWRLPTRPDVPTQMRIAQRAMDMTGPPLTQKLPEETRPKFGQLVRDYKLPAALVERMKPWFAAVTLTSAPLQKLGYDASQGVEAQLRKFSQAEGKPVSGLETTEEPDRLLRHAEQRAADKELLVETIDEQSDCRGNAGQT